MCVHMSVCSRQCEKRVMGSPVPGCRLMGRRGEWKPDGWKERQREGRNECTEKISVKTSLDYLCAYVLILTFHIYV